MIHDSPVCVRCGQIFVDDITDVKHSVDIEIRKEYNIEQMDECPIIICGCKCNDALPFDYYTAPLIDKPDEYHLIICSICRCCGGYKEIPIFSKVFPIQIREPPHVAGIKIKYKDIEEEDNGAAYVV